MKILVTGGSGLVGRFVVSGLVEHGHQVTVLDMTRPELPVHFIRCNILELGDLVYALEGHDAVVHLAAIPHPMTDPPQKVMQVNVMGTFNVLEAAARAGVPKVVLASTDSTLGFVFATHDFPPDYLPIDEAHPLRPQDSYGLSKALDEQIAASYTRRHGISTICVRICFICDTRLVNEHPEWVGAEADLRGLWVYTDGRDAAQAFRLAAEVDGLGHETCFVSADDGRNTIPTMDLIAEHFQSVACDANLLTGEYASLISNAKAKRILGYQPQHSWHDHWQG